MMNNLKGHIKFESTVDLVLDSELHSRGAIQEISPTPVTVTVVWESLEACGRPGDSELSGVAPYF